MQQFILAFVTNIQNIYSFSYHKNYPEKVENNVDNVDNFVYKSFFP